MCDSEAASGWRREPRSLERYQFVKKCVTGRSGSRVVLARDKQTGADVVVKSDIQGRDPGSEIAVSCEVHTGAGEARRLFPAVLDAGICSRTARGICNKGSEFVVLEKLPGVPMRQFLFGRDRPPARDVLAVLFQVAFALRELRRLGISHCDLHGNNVLVGVDARHSKASGRFVVSGTKRSHAFDLAGAPRAWIIDFGTATQQPLASRWVLGRYLRKLLSEWTAPSLLTLNLGSSHRPSREVVRYVANGRNRCRSLLSDLEALVVMEDLLVQELNSGPDAGPGSGLSRGPRPGPRTTFYRVLTSGRFDCFRARA